MSPSLFISVPYSHDQFRFQRQSAKSSLQLAVNSWQPNIRALIAKLLNDLQSRVEACHASPRGKVPLLAKQRLYHVEYIADMCTVIPAPLASEGGTSPKEDLDTQENEDDEDKLAKICE